MFECRGLDDLVTRRQSFLTQVDNCSDGMTSGQCLAQPLGAIHFFLEHDSLAPAFAKYVYDIFPMFPLK